MSSKWIFKDNSIMLERTGKPPLTHSILMSNDRDSYFSYSYWDYEAWIISKFNDKKILILGLGGATSLQILSKLRIPLQKVTGVDIMASQLHKEGLLNFNNLEIVNSDAYQFLKNTTNKYDLILLDVYDNDGYVQDVYNDINLLKSKLITNGTLALHCYDPMIIYYVFDFKFNLKCPLLTFYFSSKVTEHFNNTYFLPLWTSSLIITSDNDMDEYIYNSNDHKVKSKENIEYDWLDTFLINKVEKFSNMNNDFKEYSDYMDYDRIDEIDRKVVSSLYHHPSASDELKVNLKIILGEKEILDISNEDIIDKNNNLKSIQLFQLFLEFMLFKKDISQQNEKKEVLLENLDLLDNKNSKLVKSFIYSYLKKWDKALSSLY